MRSSTRKRQLIALAVAFTAIIAVAMVCVFVVRSKFADPDTPLLRSSDFSSLDSPPQIGFDGYSSALAASDLISFRSKCDTLAATEQRLASASSDPLGGRVSARGPEEVTALVLAPPGGTSASDLLAEIGKQIDSCEATVKDESTAEFPRLLERVDGLPFDAIGYRWTDGDVQAEDRAHTMTDDGRLLVVSISTSWVGGNSPPDNDPRIQPPISLDFLLKTALSRVDEVSAR